jgi:hypothetical protein
MLWLGWTVGCGGPVDDQPLPDNSAIHADHEAEDDAEDEGQEAPVPPAETPDPQAESGPIGETPAPGAGMQEPGPRSPAAPTEGTTSGVLPTPTARVDADGVLMLFPSKPDGVSWSLGTRNPNTVDKTYFDLNGDTATAGSENGISYYTTTGHKVSYASGAPDGVTVRLNIKPSGGTQRYTWRNGAINNGYISNPRDPKNLEATVYVRVNNYNKTHDSMNWKLRGGKHSSSNGSLSSCVGMSVPYGGEAPTASRELDHPNYDHVKLTPKFPYQLQAGKWVGVKVVSYLVAGGTQNRLYLDTEPFDASGKPRNNFRLYTEWVDKNGQSTGRYKQAATWGGWITTFRVDGWRRVDFTHLSAREIVPPAL